MENIIKGIEEWYDGLAPLVKNNSKAIKDDLIRRARNINDLNDPRQSDAFQKINKEMDKINDAQASLKNIFRKD